MKTVAELRNIAYTLKDISLNEQEIKMAKKDDLIKEITRTIK